jgi:hypothetical protein
LRTPILWTRRPNRASSPQSRQAKKFCALLFIHKYGVQCKPPCCQ